MNKALIPIALSILLVAGGLLTWKSKGSTEAAGEDRTETNQENDELIVVRGVEIDPTRLSPSQRTAARELVMKLREVRAKMNVSRQTASAAEMKARGAQYELDKLAVPAEDAKREARLRATEAAAASTIYEVDREHMIHFTGRTADGSNLPAKVTESDEATGKAITIATDAERKTPALRKSLSEARRSQKSALDEFESLTTQERSLESQLLELRS